MYNRINDEYKLVFDHDEDGKRQRVTHTNPIDSYYTNRYNTSMNGCYGSYHQDMASIHTYRSTMNRPHLSINRPIDMYLSDRRRYGDPSDADYLVPRSESYIPSRYNIGYKSDEEKNNESEELKNLKKERAFYTSNQVYDNDNIVKNEPIVYRVSITCKETGLSKKMCEKISGIDEDTCYTIKKTNNQNVPITIEIWDTPFDETEWNEYMDAVIVIGDTYSIDEWGERSYMSGHRRSNCYFFNSRPSVSKNGATSSAIFKHQILDLSNLSRLDPIFHHFMN